MGPWLKENLKWLFSGAGVSGITAIGPAIVRWIKTKEWSWLKNTNDFVFIGISIVMVISIAFLIRRRRKNTRTGPTTSTILPREIFAELDKAPLLQKDSIAQQYLGLSVAWSGRLDSAIRRANEIELSIYVDDDWVKFSVSPKGYPGLGLLREGHLIRVWGTISHVGGAIYLSNARIQYDVKNQ